MKTVNIPFSIHVFPAMNYGYIARTMSVFEGYAKRFLTDPVSCVNAKRPRLAWMDSSYGHTKVFDDGIVCKC